MSEPNENVPSTTEQPKKKSLAEAAKELLAQKKTQTSGQAHQKHRGNGSGGTGMKSQIMKKPNNQRRRTGV